MTPEKARRLWIHAQRLDTAEPFGGGPKATAAAVEHLGYVQIDTINVIERSHHHILFTRIPRYRREDLRRAQSVDKSVFEYWAHALAYIPTKDIGFYLAEMKRSWETPSRWFQSVKKDEVDKVLRLIRKEGAISIRDIADDELVEKDHPWASRKPSKRALQLAFYGGRLAISERIGMLKKYELMDRHFGWDRRPKAAPESRIVEYLLDRALRSQALISLDSVCYLDAKRKPALRKIVERRVKRGELIPVRVEGFEKPEFWIRPEDLEAELPAESGLVRLLSPFDPVVIQRKRLNAFFGHDHRFEAYLPKEKRVLGYFALPVLADGRIVAAVDLKTDREKEKLLLQQWTWLGKSKSAALKRRIEEEMGRFEEFQLGR